MQSFQKNAYRLSTLTDFIWFYGSLSLLVISSIYLFILKSTLVTVHEFYTRWRVYFLDIWFYVLNISILSIIFHLMVKPQYCSLSAARQQHNDSWWQRPPAVLALVRYSFAIESIKKQTVWRMIEVIHVLNSCVRTATDNKEAINPHIINVVLSRPQMIIDDDDGDDNDDDDLCFCSRQPCIYPTKQIQGK